MSEENKSPLDGAIWHHMDAATIAGFGPWVRHADHVAEIERLRAKLAEAEAEIGKVMSAGFKRAAEITTRAEAAEKRLARAMRYQSKLKDMIADAHHNGEHEVECMDRRVKYWQKRAEAAEKRLASAKEVIAPFANVLTAPDLDPNASLCDVITVGHLRAAAEWMEKGDE